MTTDQESPSDLTADDVIDDERLLSRARYHYGFFFGPAVALWAAAAVLHVFTQHHELAQSTAAIGALVWFVGFVGWQSAGLTLTTQRLYARGGFVFRTGCNIRLDEVDCVNLRRWRIGDMLGFGDLQVRRKDGTLCLFRFVHSPWHLAAAARRAIGEAAARSAV